MMHPTQIIFSVITLLLSVGLFFATYLQREEKGLPLNVAYLFTSEKDRLLINKKRYFWQSAIGFILKGLLSLTVFGVSITDWDWLIVALIGLSILLVLYGYISTIIVNGLDNATWKQ